MIIKNDLFSECAQLASDQVNYFIDKLDRPVEENHRLKTIPAPAIINTK